MIIYNPEILKYIALLNYNIALFIDQNNLMLLKKKSPVLLRGQQDRHLTALFHVRPLLVELYA